MTGEPEPPGDRVRGECSTWGALGPRRGPWWLVLLCDLAGQAARAREADRGRTALLATISHDLRAPLAAAKAAVSGLRSHDTRLTTGDRDELLAATAESLDLLSSLVENLLDASRLQAGALRYFPGQPIWVRSWPLRCAMPDRRREP